MAENKFYGPKPEGGNGVYTKEPEDLHNEVMRDLNPQVKSTYTQVGVSAPLMSKDQRKTGEVSDASSEKLKGFGYTPNM